jgi:hypothetical protein
MATRQQLATEILRKVDDPSYEDSVNDFLNNGLQDVAGYNDPATGFEILLPALETSAQVTTDADTTKNYVNMPADFHKNLYHVDAPCVFLPISIFPNFQDLKDYYTNYFDPLEWRKVGPLESVAVSNGKLYYNKIPYTPLTLTLYYYKKITLMTKENDSPIELPEHLHRDLLVNYVCKEIYTEIEEGIEGPAVNTQKYTGFYIQAISKLYWWIGDEKSKKRPFRNRQVKDF